MKTNSKILGFLRDNWMTFAAFLAIGFGAWYFTSNYLDDYYEQKHHEELEKALDIADHARRDSEEHKRAADAAGVENDAMRDALETQAEEIRKKGNRAARDAVEETKQLVDKLDEKRQEIATDPPEVQRKKLCDEAAKAGHPLSDAFCGGTNQ